MLYGFLFASPIGSLLEKKKAKVLEEYPKFKKQPEKVVDLALNKISGYRFHNHNKYDFKALAADPNNIAANFRNYISGFSESVRDIISHFNFDDQLDCLKRLTFFTSSRRSFRRLT